MVALPEIAFALCRNPAVAVGLPIALGVASGFATGELRAKRTGEPVKATCPPHPAFTYIWSACYGLMGYAAHLTVQSFDAAPTPGGTEDAQTALALYYAQLAANLIWAPLYVGSHMPKLALLDSVILTATSVAMAVKMNDLTWTNVSPTWFTAPVCAWLGYTTFVNARSVWQDENNKLAK